MDNFWILILVSFFATISLDKNESVQSVQLEELEELPLQTFDEIFGEGWWDKDKADEWDKLTLEQNFLHQIDRQPTQLGQIEPNSTDQNPPLTESDHSDGEKQNKVSSNENIDEDERKCKIVAKFHAIKEEFKQKGKYSKNKWVQIENRIAKHLKVNRSKIYEWKKEFGLNLKVFDEKERKNLVEKFDQMKAELKRNGFKNSHHKLDKTVAKELGLSFQTIYNWKRELGQTEPNKYLQSEQKESMKRYYETKTQTPIISDKDIAKMLKIGKSTLFRWKKQFKRQHLHPNSVDGHSDENNCGSNVQEIDESNAGGLFE